MLHSVTMPSVAVVDALNSLLEAEINSIFRFVEDASPYLNKASGEIRRPLHEMVESSYRLANELAELIDRLEGVPSPRSIRPEEQYLAFLSLKFLLPKLVDAKELTIRRYENILKSIHDAPAEVRDLLKRHLAEHEAQLGVLNKAAADVAAGK